jgi:hypothetical protein
MTKDEALSSSIAAVQMATRLLEKGNPELSYSWTVIADTWASIAKAIDPDLDLSGYFEWQTTQGAHTGPVS